MTLYEDEIDEFTPGPVPEKARSPSSALRELEFNPDRGLNPSSNVRNQKRRKKDALEENHELRTMPLSATKVEAEFLVADVSERTRTVPVLDAEPITDDVFANPPEEFGEHTESFVVDGEIVDCEQCDGVGDSCNNCRGKGDVRCPNRDCYNGIIKTDCDKCNGTGEYQPYSDSTTTRECNECDWQNRVKQGQCQTCGGTPPIGETGRIECQECNGSGRGEECENCNGRGELKKEVIHDVEYSIETTRYVKGHQCAKDKVDRVMWETISEEVVTDRDEIASYSVKLPKDGFVKARVTEADAVLYEGRVTIDGEEVQLFATGNNTTVKESDGYVRVYEDTLPSRTAMSVLIGAFIGGGLISAVNQFPSVARQIPDLGGMTAPVLLVTPMVVWFTYRTLTGKYSFTVKDYSD
jgi:hypothetical protein